MAVTAAALFLALTFVRGSAPTGADAHNAAFIKRRAIPGMAVAVARGNTVVMEAGYGVASLELNAPAGKDSIYEIGSITKAFTATAVMMLVEEGKLGLDDRIARYLPEAPATWSAITVRHLLGHTSGLKDWEAAGSLSYRREYTPSEYIALAAAPPLDFPAGERWSYTNTAYPLLGIIIERVSGTPYEQFVRERIFGPAKMHAARFKHAGDLVPNRSAGYVEVEGAFRNGEPMRPLVIAPNGGILSTASDLARFGAALQTGRLLKRDSLERMWTAVRLANGAPGVSGFAWFPSRFNGHRVLIHNGSTVAGFSSVILHYPDDDLTVAVLANIDRWNAVNVMAEYLAGLFVPGISAMSLPERPSPSPGAAAIAKRHLELIQQVAEGRDPQSIPPVLRGYTSPGGRRTLQRQLLGMQRWAPLLAEDLGPTGVEHLGERVRHVYCYKLVKPDGVVYYTFEISPDGRVVRFVPEED